MNIGVESLKWHQKFPDKKPVFNPTYIVPEEVKIHYEWPEDYFAYLGNDIKDINQPDKIMICVNSSVKMKNVNVKEIVVLPEKTSLFKRGSLEITDSTINSGIYTDHIGKIVIAKTEFKDLHWTSEGLNPIVVLKDNKTDFVPDASFTKALKRGLNLDN